MTDSQDRAPRRLRGEVGAVRRRAAAAEWRGRRRPATRSAAAEYVPVVIDEGREGDWPLPPGDYDAHYLLDDGYVSLAVAPFT